MTEFIGRKYELEELQQYFGKKTASLIVIRGRRRIGKSRLIEEFASNVNFLSFSGLAPHNKTTKDSQLDEFSRQYSRETGLPRIKFDDWGTAFFYLARETNKGKVVILLDEISWMGSKEPDFLGKLKDAWDKFFKKNHKLILVICGSASSWIELNILSNTGFMGRVTRDLQLEELDVRDCFEFWPEKSNISSYEKLKILAVTGGVPRYLEEINSNLPAEENIKNMCFTRDAILVKDFNQIFNDMFLSDSEMYRKIVRILASGPKENSELADALKVRQTGRLSDYLRELILAGFVKRDHTWNIKSGIDSPKIFKYRLSDNYLRFYLKYIEKNVSKIDRNLYKDKSLSTLPEWYTIMGFQFENLVLNNRKILWDKLRIRSDVILAENPYFQRQTTTQEACQFNYIIQTSYNTLYLIEIKFSKNHVGSSVINEMKSKIEKLNRPKGYSCRPVLIHVNGVSRDVELSGYFSTILSVEELLV